MSYEPHLIIRKNDLTLYKIMLENMTYEQDVNNANVAEFLLKVLQSQVIKIGGQEMYLCHPELTYFNELVREMLHEFEIEFDVWN